MNMIAILNMDINERVNLYQSLDKLERLRWHLYFDCMCNVPACYFDQPIEHMDYCPMHDSNNPNYDWM